MRKLKEYTQEFNIKLDLPVMNHEVSKNHAFQSLVESQRKLLGEINTVCNKLSILESKYDDVCKAIAIIRKVMLLP